MHPGHAVQERIKRNVVCLAREKESSRRSDKKAPGKNEADAASKVHGSLRSNGRKKKRDGNAAAVVKYAAAIIIIVAIIAAAIFTAPYILNGQSGQNAPFNSFRNNFNSAPRVDIVVAAYNGTVLSGTIGCATAIIENIVGSKSMHRNASTIDLSIINHVAFYAFLNSVPRVHSAPADAGPLEYSTVP